jgi:hypothetical protein
LGCASTKPAFAFCGAGGSNWPDRERAGAADRVRFSNRPFEVKHFLTEFPPPRRRCHSRARASLRNRHQGPSSMGFEDEAEQSHRRLYRQTDGRSKRTHDLTSSVVPRGTSFHPHGGARVSSYCILIPGGLQGAATSLVQRNSVPSTHIRCMITAKRRARATIAFFIPRFLAIFIAHALSQDHFVETTSMLWAAS